MLIPDCDRARANTPVHPPARSGSVFKYTNRDTKRVGRTCNERTGRVKVRVKVRGKVSVRVRQRHQAGGPAMSEWSALARD